MGAAAVLMYVVHSRIRALQHYLKGLIVLSPAGYHPDYPTPLKILGVPFDFIAKMVYSFRFPSDTWRILIAKVVQDIRNHQGTRNLMNLMATKMMLGGNVENAAVTAIHNLSYNALNGTSSGVYRHFRQLARSRRFQCYDYGPRRNVLEYGSAQPLDILANYHSIDIPVIYGTSIKDTLIPPKNVVAQYETLRSYHPELAYLRIFERAGHVDFTLAADDDVVNFVFESVSRCERFWEKRAAITAHALQPSVIRSTPPSTRPSVVPAPGPDVRDLRVSEVLDFLSKRRPQASEVGPVTNAESETLSIVERDRNTEEVVHVAVEEIPVETAQEQTPDDSRTGSH
jgi:pimeloyl-ACP methyl ester carboxylesterase